LAARRRVDLRVDARLAVLRAAVRRLVRRRAVAFLAVVFLAAVFLLLTIAFKFYFVCYNAGCRLINRVIYLFLILEQRKLKKYVDNWYFITK
jgi:hypothetical protein